MAITDFLKEVVIDSAKMIQMEDEEGIIVKHDPVVALSATLAYGQIASYCKRPFEKQLITEYYKNVEDARLSLRLTPVDAVTSVRLISDTTDLGKTSQEAGTVTDQSIIAVIDNWIDLEKKKISNVVVTNDVQTITYNENEDYIVDYDKGLLKCITGDGTDDIINLQEILVTFDHAAFSYYKVEENVLVLEDTSMTSAFLKGKDYYDQFPLDLRVQTYGGYSSPLTKDIEPTLFSAFIQQTIANYNRRSHIGFKSISSDKGTSKVPSDSGELLKIVKTMLDTFVYEGIAEDI